MDYIQRRLRIVFPLIAPAALVILFAAVRSEHTASASQEPKEITITLEKPDNAAPTEGDMLRKSFRFRDAIDAYTAVADNEESGVEAVKESRYYIGLCHLWLGEYDEAVHAFTSLTADYPEDGDAAGHARYCLAWIDVQRGRYGEALATLNETLAAGTVTDRELQARLLFMTGKIHLAYLNDFGAARAIFLRVGAEYPGTKIAAHPYVTAQMQ